MKRLAFLTGCSVLLGLPLTARADGRLQASGAQGEDASLSLRAQRLTITLDGGHAHTHLRQHWQGQNAGPVEGRYALQAGEAAKVSGFAYWNGEQKIVGEVFEKQTAREVYEEVTGMGRDPGLLEQTGEGAFTFRVFPIAPGERKRVDVEWDQWLPHQGSLTTYRFDFSRPTESDTAVVVRLMDPDAVAAVRSPTHMVRREGKKVIVGAPRGDRTSDAFVLEIERKTKPLELASAMHRDPGQDAYVIFNLAAPADAADRSVVDKDVTLVLDRSGSMSGEPLKHAKAAAVEMLRKLPGDDRVNVVIFDDTVKSLYDKPKALSATVRQDAIAFVEATQDGGGTNLALALDESLRAQTSDDRPDIVVFLTDGQSDAQETLKVAQADRGDVRVFTVGIGDGVEKPLLSRLAAEKRGRFTFVPNAAAIGPQMERLYDRIARPLVVDLSLRADGGSRSDLHGVYPRTLPDLFVGDEMKVVARVRGTGTRTFVLEGVMDGKPFRRTATAELANRVSRPWVARQWAVSRTDDLHEQIALYGETDELVTQARELALAYELVGPYTSFLAIPEAEHTDETRNALASARARKQAILDAHPDAAALSRSVMPPGDPVLRVRAPRNARQVTARFSFGLTADLQWDPDSEQWTTRFLVPKNVKDGTYDVEILIVDRDGDARLATTNYTIDAEGPRLEVVVTTDSEGRTVLTVTADEPLRELTALWDDAGVLERMAATELHDATTFQVTLPDGVAAESVELLGVDRARNEVRVGAVQ